MNQFLLSDHDLMKFTLKARFNLSVETLFSAWLDGSTHSKMTGGAAEISPEVGTSFTAWDGYIWGKNLKIESNRRILQSWRTSEFSNEEEDSRLKILFSEVDGGTEITLIHSNLPEHGAQYKQGWQDHYFTPMKTYFEG